MNVNKILIVIIIVMLLEICYKNLFVEHFYTSNAIKQHKAFSPFHDEMFKKTKYHDNDVLVLGTIYYDNDYDGLSGQETGRTQDGYLNSLTGWEKCKLSCPGNCLEYGLTGSAWCFDPNVDYKREINVENESDMFSVHSATNEVPQTNVQEINENNG